MGSLVCWEVMLHPHAGHPHLILLKHCPIPILPTKLPVQGSHQLHAGLCKLEDRCYLQYKWSCTDPPERRTELSKLCVQAETLRSTATLSHFSFCAWHCVPAEHMEEAQDQIPTWALVCEGLCSPCWAPTTSQKLHISSDFLAPCFIWLPPWPIPVKMSQTSKDPPFILYKLSLLTFHWCMGSSLLAGIGTITQHHQRWHSTENLEHWTSIFSSAVHPCSITQHSSPPAAQIVPEHWLATGYCLHTLAGLL